MIKKNYRFFVDKECNWFQDGKPITHKGIYEFNYQNLKVDKDNEFFIQEGESIAYVKFEDKPFFIKRVDIEKEKITLLLNDFSQENLTIDSLYFKNNIPYCKVKEGKYEARFSRPALYQISEVMVVKNGDYFINNQLINNL